MASTDKLPNANTTDTKKFKRKNGSEFSLSYFTSLEMQGPREVLNWCMNVGLISARYECPKCDKLMKLIERNRKDTFDCFEWRCRKQSKESQHDISRSVRKGSFVYNSNLSLCDVLRIIRLWFGRCMVEFAVNEINVDSHSVTFWFRFCREVCTFDIMNESSRIGGEEFTVEVVECELSGRTYTNERYFKSNWLISGIERGTNRCFFRTIKARTKEELLAIISEWVLPGSVVVSDCWNVYDCLSDQRFIELSTKNDLTFKSPGSNENDNDNSIEPVWSAVKRFLRNTAYNEKDLDSYLGEYLWRKKYFYSMSDSVFKAFLQAIVNLYNPPGRDLPS